MSIVIEYVAGLTRRDAATKQSGTNRVSPSEHIRIRQWAGKINGSLVVDQLFVD